MKAALGRRVLAEFLGTGLLVALVVGSGIMAQRTSPHDTGLELLENSTATALGLAALILMFAPVSGAHLNPVVTLADFVLGRGPGWRGAGWRDGGSRDGLSRDGLSRDGGSRDGTSRGRGSTDDAEGPSSDGSLTPREVAAYLPAQIAGGIGGAVLANLMFGLPAATASHHARTGGRLWLGEVVATAGLILLIFSLTRTGRGAVVPAAVGAYIGAAYWFTSSTSFANPAVTIARACTDTFAGIAPGSVAGFLGAQLAGAAIALLLIPTLYPTPIGVPA